MKRVKRLKSFKRKSILLDAIDNYFNSLKLAEANGDKTCTPTLTGLAIHLGFTSKEDFEYYEIMGRYAWIAKQARFKIMAYYEGRLLMPAPTGAIFALKSLGWHERPKAAEQPETQTSIEVKLIESGPKPAASEKDVAL
jgi:hypothetical protein